MAKPEFIELRLKDVEHEIRSDTEQSPRPPSKASANLASMPHDFASVSSFASNVLSEHKIDLTLLTFREF